MVDYLIPSHKVKTRKEHTCQGCGKTIQKSEQAFNTVCVDSRDIFSFYECLKCFEYYNTKCVLCKDKSYCIEDNYSVGTIKECKEEQK